VSSFATAGADAAAAIATMVFATRVFPFLFAAAVAGAVAAQRTPDEALRALRDGNDRFAAERSLVQPLGEGVRRTLARGHSPFAVVLCCADSRVPPEHVFNCGLGELFVVRVAGHCADAETIASVEYAVEHLAVPLAVVLGHEQCGAVAASAAQADQDADAHGHGAALQQLLERIEPAVRRARERALGGKDLLDACEEEHAHATVHECLRRSPLLQRYAAAGRFRIVPARYHLATGAVEWLPPRPLPAPPAALPTTAHPAPAGAPPHVALRMLQAGHRRFLGDGKPTADLTAQRREALTHGQQPLAIVLACADSRVAPEHVFDAGLGELFVVRIAGGVLNDDALASIDYAASHLGASLLVVMGHTQCGAVAGAAASPEQRELTPNLRALLTRLEPAVAAARATARGRDVVELAVRGNARRALAEARARSAVVRDLERDGRLALLGCVYDVASGDLEWLPEARDVATPEHGPATTAPTERAPRAQAAAHGGVALADGGHASAGTHEPAAAPAPAGEVAPRAHAAGTAADEHEEAHAATSPVPAGESRTPWRDPVVLVGGLGVLSLIAAALLAMRRR
jgi:carbonic anhydrase